MSILCLSFIKAEKYHLFPNFNGMELKENQEKLLKEEIAQLKAQLASLESRNQKLESAEFSHLSELFDSSNDLLQIFKPNGEIKFVNEAWRNKLGYRADELKGLKFVDVIHKDHRKKTLQSLLKITAGSSIERFETVLVSKYGKNIYVTGKLTSLFENGEIFEFRCIFFDITERFRAERAQSLYYKVASITLEPLGLDDLYVKIYNELNEILNLSSFTIAQLDENGNISFPYRIFETPPEGKQPVGDVEQLLANYTIKRGKPLIIYDEGIVKIAIQKKHKIQDLLPKIWLGVLIHVDGKPSGVLSIGSSRDQGAYNHKDLELLDFISGQISLATERKMNEGKIQNQAARLSAIFESSTHQIWSINRKYEFTSFNHNYSDAFETYYGIQPYAGMSLLDIQNNLIPSSTRSFWIKKYDIAFNGKTINFQKSLRTTHNKQIWRDVFVNPIFLPTGEIEEISVIANDITEKRMSETALKESEEKFRNIFVSFQDIYFRCNTDGVLSMVSPSVVEVLGISPKAMIGKKITDFFIPKTKLSELLKRLFSDKKVRNFEGSVNTQNNEEIHFLSNVRLIRSSKSKFEIEGVARDISILKKTNQELIQAKDLAVRSLKIKERFLANMSHEIRTPMNGIIGMIDLIATTNLDSEQTDYIRTIKKSSDTLLTILNDILDLSKIEAGKMELRKEPVKITETFEKVYELYSQQAHLINNTLYYHLDDQLPDYILADETRLLQVLSNLTSNAIKFSSKKGNINLSIRVLSKKEDTYTFKVSVKDSGIGIAKKDVNKLFENFSQLDSSSSKNYSGTGLGLAISRELVKSMGGEISVVSTPGLGSTFSFTFIADQIAVNQVTKKQDEQVFVRQFIETSPKVLLVDDNDINRKVALSILRKSGCEAHEASSGFEAIELVNKNNYDLIFMDIQMPNLDGIETTKILREIPNKVIPAIVAMTAYSMEEDRAAFIDQGLDDYVPKPIKANDLINTVKKWLHFEPQQVTTEVFNELTEQLTINQNTLNHLHKYGGKELIQTVLDDFDTEVTEQAEMLVEHLKNNEYQELKGILHTLKGNAGTLGIEKLSKCAADMEKSIKENKFESLPTLLDHLLSNLTEFKESYHNFIKN
jgi:PAS domain S-box-containing protein